MLISFSLYSTHQSSPVVLLVNKVTDEGENVESKIIFRLKKRAKCLRTNKASLDGEEENNEEDMRYFISYFCESWLLFAYQISGIQHFNFHRTMKPRDPELERSVAVFSLKLEPEL